MILGPASLLHTELDPALSMLLCRALEGAIRKALLYDPGTASALEPVSGKILAVVSTQPAIKLYFVCHPTEFQVLSHYEERAECQIEGDAGALVALLWSEQESLADSGVTISGEVGFLLQLKRLLSRVDIDWEQPICDALGDTVGYPLTRLIRKQFAWAKQRAKTTPLWVNDMLTQEFQASPSKVELDNFYRDVDALRAGTERMQAQIALLKRTHAGRADGAGERSSIVKDHSDRGRNE